MSRKKRNNCGLRRDWWRGEISMELSMQECGKKMGMKNSCTNMIHMCVRRLGSAVGPSTTVSIKRAFSNCWTASIRSRDSYLLCCWWPVGRQHVCNALVVQRFVTTSAAMTMGRVVVRIHKKYSCWSLLMIWPIHFSWCACMGLMRGERWTVSRTCLFEIWSCRL